MATIRRHWKLAILNLVILCLALWAGTYYLSRPPATADVQTDTQTAPPTSAPTTQPQGLDTLTFSRIDRLRQELCLTSVDLGAMGCSQSQATAVFSGLLSWYQANQANWTQYEQAELTAQQNVQEANREINVGPANATLISQFPTLQQTLTTASSQFTTFRQGAASAASSVLSSSQQQVWSSARANASAPDVYRYAPALSAQEISSANATLVKAQTASALTLTAEQQQAVNTAISQQQQSMPGVLAAEQAVLPRPANMP